MTALSRRSTYRPSLVRADYFVVRALGGFIERALCDHVRPGMLVVDVGCGEQPWRPLVETLGARYLGADVRQNAAGSVVFRCAADALPLRHRSVGLVLCTEVVEHVPDPTRALAELARVLRPEGLAVVTTPFLYPLHEEPWDFQRLTRYQLARTAAAAGFTVEHLSTAGNEIEVLATLWDRLWSNAIPPGLARTGALALLRPPANFAAWLISGLAGRALPRRAYLSNLALLRAPARPA
jgi:SAM-dependent methyltransferase